MLKQLAPEEVMKEFDNDEYKAGFKHTDVPGGLR